MARPIAFLNPRLQIISRRNAVHWTDRISWWNAYHKAWDQCVRCPLFERRQRVVHWRGIIPAPVLFIGEAPGIVEDDQGYPFVGPSGGKLDSMIEGSGLQDGDYCIINMLGCLPPELSPAGGLTGRVRAPTKEELKACSPRVDSLVEAVQPKLTFLLGKVAASKKLANKLGRVVELVHPSHILQATGSKAILAEKRFRLTLTHEVEQLKSSGVI